MCGPPEPPGGAHLLAQGLGAAPECPASPSGAAQPPSCGACGRKTRSSSVFQAGLSSCGGTKCRWPAGREGDSGLAELVGCQVLGEVGSEKECPPGRGPRAGGAGGRVVGHSVLSGLETDHTVWAAAA